MSDFLSNLVTRSLGAPEGIRPRPASLFEPPRGVAGSLFGAEAEPAEPFDPPDPGFRQPEAAPARRPARQSPELAAPPHPLAQAHLPEARPSRPGQPVPLPPVPPPLASSRAVVPPSGDATSQATPVPAPSAIPPAPAARPTLTPLAEQSPPQPGPALVRPVEPAAHQSVTEQPQPPEMIVRVERDSRHEQTVERIVIARSVPAELRPALPPPAQTARGQEALQPAAERRQAVAAPVSNGQDAARPKPALADAEAPTGQFLRPAPAPIVVQARVLTQDEPAAQPIAEPAPQQPPVVQVTIGRIEVRATPPPAAPAQRPRATPPVMSLDEYLRQRAKRGS